MYAGKTPFAQLMDFVPWSTFARLVARYGGDARVRKLDCTEQYRVMAFAQLTYRESLRDIEACLTAARRANGASIPADVPVEIFRQSVAPTTRQAPRMIDALLGVLCPPDHASAGASDVR